MEDKSYDDESVKSGEDGEREEEIGLEKKFILMRLVGVGKEPKFLKADRCPTFEKDKRRNDAFY